MKILLKLISFVGLLLTVVPAFLVFTGILELSQHKTLMLIGTLIWFASSPFWVGKPSH